MAFKRKQSEQQPVNEVAADAPPPADDAAPVAAEPPAPEVSYRVKASKSFSYYGQMTTLKADEIIHERHYGAAGIARMQEAGVELEKL